MTAAFASSFALPLPLLGEGWDGGIGLHFERRLPPPQPSSNGGGRDTP